MPSAAPDVVERLLRIPLGLEFEQEAGALRDGPASLGRQAAVELLIDPLECTLQGDGSKFLVPNSVLLKNPITLRAR